MNRIQAEQHYYNIFIPKLEKLLHQNQHLLCKRSFDERHYRIEVREKSDFNRAFFYECAADSIRGLGNSVNDLLFKTLRLKAWQSILNDCKTQESRKIIVADFIQPEGEMALLLPYTIKSRFYFAAASVSHQANLVAYSNLGYDDNLLNLPADERFSEDNASKPLRNWRRRKKLYSSLRNANSENYRSLTRNFRNVFIHRYQPSIEIGSSRAVNREVCDEALTYRYGGSEPLKISDVTSALSQQCVVFREAFVAFEELICEQVEKLEKV